MGAPDFPRQVLENGARDAESAPPGRSDTVAPAVVAAQRPSQQRKGKLTQRMDDVRAESVDQRAVAVPESVVTATADVLGEVPVETDVMCERP